MGPIQTVDEFVDMIRRRARMIFAVSLLGAVASVLFALSLPHQYISSQVIQIERPRVSSELVASTVEGSSARRLQLIEQKLMAREAVQQMIEEFGLFRDLPALTELEKVALFRESVSIEGVAAAREGMADDGTVSALTIRAQLGSPEAAQAVVAELGRRTIALSAEARAGKTRAALEFFRAEEEALIETVAALEAEMAGLRSGNELAIAGGIETRQEQIGAIEQALLAVEQNRISIQQQIDQLDGGSQRPATLRRLVELERQTDALAEQRVFLVNRRDQIRAMLTLAPEVERQLAVLQVRLEQYQDRLGEIAARRAEAEIGQRLEASRQAERMEVLEPASLPDYPAEPSRRKIAAAGALASVVAALALAFYLELRTPVIRTAAQMQRELGFAPAIAIPEMAAKRLPREPLMFVLGRSVWRLVARAVPRAQSVRIRLPGFRGHRARRAG